MPIPKEILAVKRPRNTIVIAYGKNKDHYAVRKRIGCRNVNGRHLPVNGPTIGHIVDGVYVPIEEIYPGSFSTSSNIGLKDWADITLCDNLFQDVRDELLAAFNREDALKIYCIAVLRVCIPGIRDEELQTAYENSFLSETYKDVELSGITVSKFWKDLGRKCSKITAFMKNRIAAAGEDVHLLIDGTVQSGGTYDDPLSGLSRKAGSRKTGDISVLYAYDMDKMEPVCSECFPGNRADAAACESFLSGNGITKGIIAADQRFPFSDVSGLFKNNPGLHYLRPVRESAKLIRTYNLLEFGDKLEGDREILFRKEKCKGRRIWYYAFRDCEECAAEEKARLRSASDDLEERRPFFGTFVLESDMDLLPEDVYRAYTSRQEIGLVMRSCDSACAFAKDGEMKDPSVAGSGFCDFLSALLTCRLISAFDREHLLDEMTFREVMSILRRAKKVRTDCPDWMLVRMSSDHEDILRALGLLPALDALPKRKRGRPRKNPTWT